jgi:hypothetical protein
MNNRNIKLGFVTVALLNGSSVTAYIREYSVTDGIAQARTMVNGTLIQAQWNAAKWIQTEA